MCCLLRGVQLLRLLGMLMALMLANALAHAAEISVTSAQIQAGKLVIKGTTDPGGMKVRLDGQTVPAFNVTSNTQTKVFTFSLVYHPGDCIVALQRVFGNSSLGTATNALVGNCGPRALSPRGAWNASANYLINDLVTSLGSSWRAKRDNTNRPPATNLADWEKFVSKGDTGATGPAGATGATGASGPQGPAGPAGTPGQQGPPGLQGTQGQRGPAGADGRDGADGAQGLQGPSGVVQTVSLLGAQDMLDGPHAFAFVGPVSSITLTASQRFTASATVPAWTYGGQAITTISLCYRRTGGGIEPFGGPSSGMLMVVSTTMVTLAASATVQPGAGTYQVGMCMANDTNVDVFFDMLNGWILVTN